MFGEYPKTIKSRDITITSTLDCRGCYLGNDREYYTKITASPYGNKYKFSDGSTVTYQTTYYFKVKPILWRILTQSDDTALILCDSIIVNKEFDSNSNNYKNSDLRAWLNKQFYEWAFNQQEREIILTSKVYTSLSSTEYTNNKYLCEDISDYIFLPSYEEVTNSAYGFNPNTRRIQTTDFSRAIGAYMSTELSLYGNGNWWLRTPSDKDSWGTRFIGIGGYVGNINLVSNKYMGVVPALQIRL